MPTATDTVNTMPAATSTFLPALQEFLRDEPGDQRAEMGLHNMVISGGLHSTSASLVSPSFACVAYPGGHRVSQASTTITYLSSRTSWVIVHQDDSGTAGTFTRVAGTHFLVDSQSGTTRPSLPSNAIWLMAVVTDGTAITSVTDLRNIGVLGALSAELFATLNDAVTAISTSTQALRISHSLPIVSNLTVPNNVILDIQPQGRIDLNGFTLTLNCGLQADRQQVFTGSGTVNGSPLVDEVFPDWFGVGGTDDGPSFNKAIALCPTRGGRVTFIQRGVSYKIQTTITIDKGIYFGCPGAIVGTPDRTRTGPILEWTGTGSALISVQGTTGGNIAHNAYLEGFALDNSGTGTVGIDVGTLGNNPLHATRLFRIACSAPQTPFSVAGIRASGTLANTLIRLHVDQCHFRDSAPVGLELSNINNIAWVTRSSFIRHVGSDMRLGQNGQARDVYIWDCETHQDVATEGDVGIEVVNVEGLHIHQHYFELHSAGAGAGSFGFRIASGATTAAKTTLSQCSFRVNPGTFHPILIAKNDEQTHVHIHDCWIDDNSAGDLTAFVDNDLTTLGYIRIENNHANNDIPMANSGLRVDERNNTSAVNAAQFLSPNEIVRLDTLLIAPVENSGTTETDLYTYTVPAGTVWRNGKGLVFRASGRTAINGNNKTLRVYFAGTVVQTVTAAANNADWFVEMRIDRQAGTNVEAILSIMWFNNAMVAPVSQQNTIAAVDWTTAMIVKVTGQSATATGDVIIDRGDIWLT